MRILISTPVQGSVPQVFARFDSKLLLKLTPPLMHVRLLRMDEPMAVGGIVHVEVKMLGVIRQEWYNEISAHGVTPHKAYFTDVGVRLPGMFQTWKHTHIVQQRADGITEIVDDIQYTSKNKLFTALLYPLVYLQFYYRRPIYHRFFRQDAA